MNAISSGPISARLHRAIRMTFSLLILLPCASTGRAQTRTSIVLHLDPSTTQIHWTLNTTVHTVHGTFKLKAGNIRIDPSSGDATGLIVIDAASGESGEDARDKRMHSAILESAKYPTINFSPTHVEGRIDLVAGGPITLTGAFSLHGQEHPLRIAINLKPQRPGDPSASNALTAHFTVPFVAWGLKDPSTFIFRTDKEVILDTNAIVKPAAAN